MSKENVTQSIADGSSEVNDRLKNLNDSSKTDMQSNQNLQNETIEFDWRFYLELYPDLAVLSNGEREQVYEHWVTLGQKEGRVSNKSQFTEIYLKNLPADFDWQEYLALNPDLQSLIQNELQAITHFVMIGKNEGRNYIKDNLEFDAKFYLELYSDLASLSEQDAYIHWCTQGKVEGRVANRQEFYDQYMVWENLPINFNWKKYLILNQDLYKNIKNELQAIYHFVTLGIKEGRKFENTSNGNYESNNLITIFCKEKFLAEEIYKKIVDLRPRLALPYIRLGIINEHLSNNNDALKCYEKAIEVEAENPSVYVKIIEFLIRQEKWQDALTKCNESLAIHKNNLEINNLSKKLQKTILIKENVLAIAEILFDEQFYKKQFVNQDYVQKLNKSQTFQHFLDNYNISSKDDPIPAPTQWFFPEIYIDIHSDTIGYKENPFLHYLGNGFLRGFSPLEGIDSIPPESIKARITNLFDEEFYADNNSDIDLEKVNLFDHYMYYGYKEYRNPNSWFNVKEFLIKFPGFQEFEINPLYLYACLHSGDPRKVSTQTIKKSNKGKIFEIVPNTKETLIPSCAMEFNSILKKFGYLEHSQYFINSIKVNPKQLIIHFVIPEFDKGGGGHMNIFRIIKWLEFFGHKCTIWINNFDVVRHPTGWRDDVYRYYQQIKSAVLPLDSNFWFIQGDVLVATSWDTVEIVMAQNNFKDRFYFIQDYEPYFFPKGASYFLAENTYRSDIACICGSLWLKNIMQEKFGRWAKHFDFAYDENVYKVNKKSSFFEDINIKESTNNLVVYSRKHTARRSVELILEALKELSKKRNDFVVHFFGDNTPVKEVSYEAYHHGVLNDYELAELYNMGNIGIVFSATNYSIVPKEMMACGLPVIDIENESTVAVFPSGVVTLAQPNIQGIVCAIENLLDNPKMRETQIQEGFKWIQGLSWQNSARQVEKAFLDHLSEKKLLEEEMEVSNTIAIQERHQFHSTVVIPTFNGGELLIKVLETVRQQDTPWPFQILIIDSSSTDGTLEYLDGQKDINLHKISQSEFQHGATRNLAVKMSDSEYVAFLTQDALPSSNYWLYNLVSCLEDHPLAGGVFGRHIPYENASLFTKRDLELHFANFDNFPVEVSLGTNFEKFRNSDTSWKQMLHFYSDNNSCLRKSVWDKCPYPNVPFGEDQLWADLIIKAGYSKIYSKDATVYHSHDYNYDETFKRARIEAEFFMACFGYVLVKDGKTLESDLKIINENDIKYGKVQGLSQRDILERLCLNRAKLEGWLLPKML